MCNRFRAAYFTPEDIEETFQAFEEIEGKPHKPRFNVAPTQPILTVRIDHGKRKISDMRWGLIPNWAGGLTSANFNARSETITNRPSFRDLIGSNRCLIPADGFYEWQKIGGVNQPFAFEVGNRELFAFAGLWDEWKGPDGKVIQSCTILTTESNSLVAAVHNRMPVIVTKERYGAWLNPKTPLETVLAILKPFDPQQMRKYLVSTKLNNSQNEGLEIAEPIELEMPSQGSLFSDAEDKKGRGF
jgi:putative SOS response-associated peptidase YedK